MSQSQMPDFFIIGAPKCGTTALYQSLSDHPSVFMAKIKEPHYFSTDFPSYRQVRDLESYLSLFSQAPSSSTKGEASVWYLYSEVAVGEIMRLRPDAKFIVMLRHPVDAAQSLHAQQVIGLIEDIPNFEKAWRAQEDRATGRRIPFHVLEPAHLQYGKICSFSKQVERLLGVVPRNQVLLLFYEQFFLDPEKYFRAVELFLELDQQWVPHFERLNMSRAPANAWLHRHLSGPPVLLRPAHAALKKLSRRFGLRLGRLAMFLMNVRTTPRPKLRREFEQELHAFFAEDVDRLGAILGYDLEFWKGTKSR